MDGMIIAIAGLLTAVGTIYVAYTGIVKSRLENAAKNNEINVEGRKTEISEFTAALNAYRDLKQEYKLQVDELKAENGKLHIEVSKLHKEVSAMRHENTALRAEVAQLKQLMHKGGAAA